MGIRGIRRLWVAVLLCVSAPSLVAQSPASGPPRIEIKNATATNVPSIAARDVLSANPYDELLRNGFPARLHFRVEVWTEGRWFDDLVARTEWDVIIQYDLIDRTYEVARLADNTITSLGNYSRFQDARAASELAFVPPLTLPTGRRGYFAVQVDAQTLEISDLAEMQRWLRGEARPAVQGKRNPGTALTRGVRSLVSRLLGGEVRRLETRSAVLQF